jgi:hypothetical protein
MWPERSDEHACKLATDGLLEASESGRSGVVEFDQDGAEQFVASLVLG